jgi:PAS domain-containing protein
MSLVQELIKELLPDNQIKVGVYGGSFKPPTKGHFEVVKTALEQNKDIDILYIFVGKGERDGVTQDDAMNVWGIYKNYLPNNVKIVKATKPPIQEIYNFAKENPEKEVLWILGARENDDSDFADIANRTKSVDKYPNIELRVIVTKNAGISGTAARNASKVNKEKLEPFLPGFLTDMEKNNIYVLLNNELTEGRKKKKDPKKGTGKKPKKSGRRLYTDEDPKDTVGVKFSTRQDIVNTLGKKSFKAKSHARQSQIINLIHQRVRAALSRTKDPKKKAKLRSGFEYIKKRKEASKAKTQRLKKQKSENIDPKIQAKHKGKAAPYGSAYKKVKEGDTIEKYSAKGKATGKLKQGTVRKRLGIKKGEKIPITKINKELSRLRKMDKDKDKKGTQLGDKNQKYYKALNLAKTLKTTTNINEEASYSNYIDYKSKIIELTKHMLDKGMNILPLPKVYFKHGDSENAKKFLGKTAYYYPPDMSIVLYTEGRHPKDIVRSFSHEMIHHIQNLENRLGNVTTTNTTEDEYLTQLEAEANLRGTMTFRGWTDSLQEGKKKKDPFGLNAYAAELARLRENDSKYQIYLDMDGVIADFNQRFENLSGMEPSSFEQKYGKDLFWDFIDEKNKLRFWVGIPVMEGAKQLVDYVSKHDYTVLTAPSMKKESRLGKLLWIRNKTGDLFNSKPQVIFKKAKEKHKVKPSLTEFDILIDDRADTVDRWTSAGGTGILFQSASQAIKELKKLGL